MRLMKAPMCADTCTGLRWTTSSGRRATRRRSASSKLTATRWRGGGAGPPAISPRLVGIPVQRCSYLGYAAPTPSRDRLQPVGIGRRQSANRNLGFTFDTAYRSEQLRAPLAMSHAVDLPGLPPVEFIENPSQVP